MEQPTGTIPNKKAKIEAFNITEKKLLLLFIALVTALLASNVIPSSHSKTEENPPIPRIPLDVNAIMEP